jgi:hypothetical protein
MKNNLKSLVLIAIAAVGFETAHAQYPEIPADVQKTADSLLNAARIHSDAAWAFALPIIQEEAAKYQRPYVPWAARPVK